jgi:hypothetical protein
MQKLPETSDVLIDELDKAFPLQNFTVDTPYHAMQRAYGARDVIDFLRAMQQERAERAAEELGGKRGGDEGGQWSTR